MTSEFTIQPADLYDLHGTSLMGYMKAAYSDLVVAFGPPTFDGPSGDGKTDVEWLLKITDHEFDEEHIVTIYNWKDFDGGVEARSNPEYEWHIGGTKRLVVGMLIKIFREKLANA